MTLAIELPGNTSAVDGPIQIGILGSGPAALMAALSLEAYFPNGEVAVTLMDRSTGAAAFPGVGFGIQERACRALERIGQLEAAMIRANPCTEIAFYNSRLGKRFRSIFPNALYTRSVVSHEFLADIASLLRTTAVLRGHAVERITALPDGRIDVMGQSGGLPFEMQFDLLIAADGIHSVARQEFFPGHATTHDRGFSYISMVADGTGWDMPISFLDRANGGRSELIMGSIATVTVFPLAKNRLALGVGFDHRIRAELWASQGLDDAMPWTDIPALLRRSIAQTLATDTGDADLVRALDLIDDWTGDHIHFRTMLETPPLGSPYPYTPGNSIVIGDSAYTTPTIGMGASIAIEDAEALIAAIHGSHCWESRALFLTTVKERALEPFAKRRVPVWHDLIRRARAAAVGNFIEVGRKRRFAIGMQIPRQPPAMSSSRFEAALE